MYHADTLESQIHCAVIKIVNPAIFKIVGIIFRSRA
ncbi:hypothetical protein LCGC14_1607900, partial [marine sediment metagenome]